MTTISGISAMRATMAQAHEQFSAGGSTPSNASQVLASGSDFLQHARESLTEISTLIDARRMRIDQLEHAHGSKRDIDHEREQIELLTALQERIQQSMQRIAEILAGASRSEPDLSAGRMSSTSAVSSQHVLRAYSGARSG